MTHDDSLTARTGRLLDEARYLNLATVSPESLPWVSVVEYAWLAGPLRFVFGSATGSRHSRDIASSPRVSGSLFVTGGAATGVDFASVDGAQFTGRCAEIPADELDRYHSVFYEAVFPEEAQRTEWM
ncbi:MAG: pyridoxamine 5'-phosphate oxidase family protein, partial [Streptomyces sp.]